MKNKKNKPLDQRGYGKVESLCTFQCNCRCIMCSVAGKTGDSKNTKTSEDVKKDIDIAVRAKARTFAFSGGEPTLRKDLFELVQYAKKKIRNVEIQSNGRIYYYKDYCKRLIKAGVNVFVVSFCSPFEDVHDQIMGVRGSYAQTLQGLKNLRALKQTIKVNIVLLKPNYQHVAELVRFLLDLGVKEFRFILVTLEGNVLKDPEAVAVSMSEVAPYLLEALKIGTKKVPCYVYNMVPCLLPGYEENINDVIQADTYLRGPDFECSIDENRKKMKVKHVSCRECKYDKGCYGVWKNYVDFFGLDELKPIKKRHAKK